MGANFFMLQILDLRSKNPLHRVLRSLPYILRDDANTDIPCLLLSLLDLLSPLGLRHRLGNLTFERVL